MTQWRLWQGRVPAARPAVPAQQPGSHSHNGGLLLCTAGALSVCDGWPGAPGEGGSVMWLDRADWAWLPGPGTGMHCHAGSPLDVLGDAGTNASSSEPVALNR